MDLDITYNLIQMFKIDYVACRLLDEAMLSSHGITLLLSFQVNNHYTDKQRKIILLRQLLQQSHMSWWHANIPNWVKNSTSFQITIPPLRSSYAKAYQHHARDMMDMATNANASFYKIINPKTNYSLCDVLEIQIFTRNVYNNSKTTGGDYLFTKVHSPDLLASSNPEGGIEDHQNGSYTARFKLRWTGRVFITVVLMQSSEAISVLRRVRDQFPARQAFEGVFIWNGKASTHTPCHVTTFMYLPNWENSSNVVEFCNYTDPLTGSPWYCVKPEGYPCSSYTQHAGSPRGKMITKSFLNPQELLLMHQ